LGNALILTQSADPAMGLTTRDDLFHKIQDCAEGFFAFAAVEQSAWLIESLEEVDDIASLIRSTSQ
jgi:hypothetical protein